MCTTRVMQYLARGRHLLTCAATLVGKCDIQVIPPGQPTAIAPVPLKHRLYVPRRVVLLCLIFALRFLAWGRTCQHHVHRLYSSPDFLALQFPATAHSHTRHEQLFCVVVLLYVQLQSSIHKQIATASSSSPEYEFRHGIYTTPPRH